MSEIRTLAETLEPPGDRGIPSAAVPAGVARSGTGDEMNLMPLSAAPAPPGRVLDGHLSDFSRDPLGFLTNTARQYGPVVQLRFARTRACLISDPDLIKAVLVDQNHDFIKSRAIRAQRHLLGNGLLINEGGSWLRQRRLAQPAFHRERIAEYAQIMVDCAERMFARWKEGEVRDFHQEMQNLTSAIVSRTLFGNNVDGERDDLAAIMERAMEQYASRRGLARLFPEWFPLSTNRRYHNAVRRLDEILFRIIRERRASGEDPGDLLSMLLHARDDEGSGMDDQQLRDEVVNLFLGGYDTPALALSWVAYLLARHPTVEEHLHAEVDSVLAGRKPAAADLPVLRYTDGVILEAMRLYPPAWILSREAVRDTTLGQYRIPAGTQVLFSQWVAHRDPRFFEDPERFLPERWVDGLEKRLPRYAYFPFGAGQRLCIGASFAHMETVLLLASIAQKFCLKLAPGREVVPWPSLTLRPRGGVPVIVTRRERDTGSPPTIPAYQPETTT